MQILSLTSMYNKVYQMGFEITNSMRNWVFDCCDLWSHYFVMCWIYFGLSVVWFCSIFPIRLGILIFLQLCSVFRLYNKIYMTIHFLWRRFIGSGFNTARTASSNTWNKTRTHFQNQLRRWIIFMLIRCFIVIRERQSKWSTYEIGGQTCFSPRCVSAEHSIYFTALILLANFWPCSRFNGDKPCSDKALNVSLSSLKSILVPIQRQGNVLKKLSTLKKRNCREREKKNEFVVLSTHQLRSLVHLGSDAWFQETTSMLHFQMMTDWK